MTTNILLRSLIRVNPHLYTKKLFPSSQNLSCINSLKFSRLCSTVSCYQDKDPAPLFFDDQVQKVLKKLTGLNLEKIYKNKYLENPDSVEEYKFLTKEELEQRTAASIEEATRLLQMPPIIKEREPIKEILSYDPAIQSDEWKGNLVITDISFGVSDRERIILVREDNGLLRRATWEERDRMNYIYNPRPGRYHKVPPVFQEPYLEDALNREEYIFVLDFACAHFEPDDPKFHEITRTTFEHIRRKLRFETLSSTRHFGPMCFYYAWTKKIDALLIQYVHQERIEEAADLVKLYYIINDEAKLSSIETPQDQLNIVKKYAAEEAKIKSSLELAVQTYDEAVRERENLEKMLKASHGIS